MSEPFREMTVGELRERLAEMPDYYCVTVLVNGTAGVITGVWQQRLDPDRADTPHVLIGEREPASPIVPPHWTEPRAACTWPRCRRSPNPCLAWCKCPCHEDTRTTH